ncbi:MAG: helix-turn-helix domain-containing protein, partial [Acidimicrobiia bacterium]
GRRLTTLDDFDRALGERLRAARRRRGWSLHDVERTSGNEFKSSVLGAYERGERSISVQRLHRLAQIYAVDVARLIPTSEDADDQPTVIDLDAMGEIDATVSEAIDRFLSAIQLRRRSSDGDLTVRQSDLEFLAALVRSDRATVRRAIAEPE